MSNSTTFGGRIKLEGESEYRAALKNINSELKLIGAEMEATGKSAEKLARQQELATQKVTEQKVRVGELEKALERAKINYGESSKEANEWSTKLNQAKTTLVEMEKELEGYNKALQESTDKMATFSKKLSDDFLNAAEKTRAFSASCATALTAMGTGIAGLAINASKTADELLTMSSITGMSTDELQKWNYMAELVDVSQETINGSLRKLTANMQKAQQGSATHAEAFRSLGVEYQKAGQLLDKQEVFYNVIDALGKIENETQRDAIAMEIFGKSAANLNPMIEMGREGLESLGTEFDNLGIAIDEEGLRVAGEFDDMMQRIKAILTQSAAEIGTELIPVLMPILEELPEKIKGIADWLSKLDPNVVATTAAFLAVGAAISPVLTGLGNLISLLPKLSAGLTLLAAHPVIATIGVAAAALGGLIALGKRFADTQKEIEREVNGSNSAIEQQTRSVEKQTSVFDKLTTTTAELKESHEALNKQIDDTEAKQLAIADTANRLTDRLDELSKKTNKTAEENEELKKTVNDLNELMPDLKLTIDEETGALSKNTEEIKKNVQALQLRAKATALEEKYTDSLKAEIDYETQASKRWAGLREKYGNDSGGISLWSQDFKDIEDFAKNSDKIWNGMKTAYTNAAQYGRTGEANTLKEYIDSISEAKAVVNALSEVRSDSEGYFKQWQTMQSEANKITSEITEAEEEKKEKETKKEVEKETSSAVKEAEKTAKQTASTSKASLGSIVENVKDAIKDEIEARTNAFRTEKADLDEMLRYELISEEEYYQRLKALRDEYNNYISESDKRQIDYTLKQRDKQLQKNDYTASMENSFKWIETRVNNNDWNEFSDNIGNAIDRVKERVNKAFEEGILSTDEYEAALSDIESRAIGFYEAQKNGIEEYIAQMDYYSLWDKVGDSQSQAYTRMLANARDYYDKGLIDYETYKNDVLSISQKLYTAQSAETDAQLSREKEKIQARITELQNELKAFDDNYTREQRAQTLQELKAEAAKYSGAVTISGQEHYESLLSQIAQKEHEQERYELEQKNNALIAELNERYKELENRKVDLLTSIAETLPQVAQVLGGIVTNNSSYNTNTNIGAINIADGVDLSAYRMLDALKYTE